MKSNDFDSNSKRTPKITCSLESINSNKTLSTNQYMHNVYSFFDRILNPTKRPTSTRQSKILKDKLNPIDDVMVLHKVTSKNKNYRKNRNLIAKSSSDILRKARPIDNIKQMTNIEPAHGNNISFRHDKETNKIIVDKNIQNNNNKIIDKKVIGTLLKQTSQNHLKKRISPVLIQKDSVIRKNEPKITKSCLQNTILLKLKEINMDDLKKMRAKDLLNCLLFAVKVKESGKNRNTNTNNKHTLKDHLIDEESRNINPQLSLVSIPNIDNFTFKSNPAEGAKISNILPNGLPDEQLFHNNTFETNFCMVQHSVGPAPSNSSPKVSPIRREISFSQLNITPHMELYQSKSILFRKRQSVSNPIPQFLYRPNVPQKMKYKRKSKCNNAFRTNTTKSNISIFNENPIVKKDNDYIIKGIQPIITRKTHFALNMNLTMALFSTIEIEPINRSYHASAIDLHHQNRNSLLTLKISKSGSLISFKTSVPRIISKGEFSKQIESNNAQQTSEEQKEKKLNTKPVVTTNQSVHHVPSSYVMIREKSLMLNKNIKLNGKKRRSSSVGAKISEPIPLQKTEVNKNKIKSKNQENDCEVSNIPISLKRKVKNNETISTLKSKVKDPILAKKPKSVTIDKRAVIREALRQDQSEKGEQIEALNQRVMAEYDEQSFSQHSKNLHQMKPIKKEPDETNILNRRRRYDAINIEEDCPKPVEFENSEETNTILEHIREETTSDLNLESQNKQATLETNKTYQDSRNKSFVKPNIPIEHKESKIENINTQTQRSNIKNYQKLRASNGNEIKIRKLTKNDLNRSNHNSQTIKSLEKKKSIKRLNTVQKHIEKKDSYVRKIVPPKGSKIPLIYQTFTAIPNYYSNPFSTNTSRRSQSFSSRLDGNLTASSAYSLSTTNSSDVKQKHPKRFTQKDLKYFLDIGKSNDMCNCCYNYFYSNTQSVERQESDMIENKLKTNDNGFEIFKGQFRDFDSSGSKDICVYLKCNSIKTEPSIINSKKTNWNTLGQYQELENAFEKVLGLCIGDKLVIESEIELKNYLSKEMNQDCKVKRNAFNELISKTMCKIKLFKYRLINLVKSKEKRCLYNEEHETINKELMKDHLSILQNYIKANETLSIMNVATPLDFFLLLGYSAYNSLTLSRNINICNYFYAIICQLKLLTKVVEYKQLVLLYLMMGRFKLDLMRYLHRLIGAILNGHIDNYFKLDKILGLLELSKANEKNRLEFDKNVTEIINIDGVQKRKFEWITEILHGPNKKVISVSYINKLMQKGLLETTAQTEALIILLSLLLNEAKPGFD